MVGTTISVTLHTLSAAKVTAGHLSKLGQEELCLVHRMVGDPHTSPCPASQLRLIRIKKCSICSVRLLSVMPDHKTFHRSAFVGGAEIQYISYLHDQQPFTSSTKHRREDRAEQLNMDRRSVSVRQTIFSDANTIYPVNKEFGNIGKSTSFRQCGINEVLSFLRK